MKPPFIKGREPIEQDLERRRRRLFDGHLPELLNVLSREIPSLRDAIIVDHVPEQYEDIWVVLVDPDRVAMVEIGRQPEPHLVQFEIRSADDYGRQLRGRSSRQFTIAREMISSKMQ